MLYTCDNSIFGINVKNNNNKKKRKKILQCNAKSYNKFTIYFSLKYIILQICHSNKYTTFNYKNTIKNKCFLFLIKKIPLNIKYSLFLITKMLFIVNNSYFKLENVII